VSRTSLPGKGGVRFDEGSDNSAPPSRTISPLPQNSGFTPPKRTDSAPPAQNGYTHKRSASEAHGYRKYIAETPSRLSYEQSRPAEEDLPPPPPRHGGPLGSLPMRPGGPGGLERIQSEAEVPTIGNVYNDMHAQAASTPSLLLPVASPPAFQHNPGARPANSPMAPPELRRAHSNVDAATLYQMQDAARGQRTPEEEYANGQSNQNNRVSSSSYAEL
jgi:CCR4-NOT transcriptional complex subunit CAF120